VEAVRSGNKTRQAAANTGSSDFIVSCDIWEKYSVIYRRVHNKFYFPLLQAISSAFFKMFLSIFNRYLHFS
jgi:hypothetical protein